MGVSLPAAGDLALRKVVIDAGHGGKDPGAVSQDRKTYEKTLTLDIARRLGTKISEGCPEVRVEYTRSSDSFVSLDDRAVSANKRNADLFISIHVNSSKATSASGYSVHVLGQSSNRNRDLYAYNMDVCKRENSVILLEDDYSTKYQGFDPSDPESFIFMQLMQNSHLEQSLLLSQLISDSLEGGPIRSNRGVWQNPFYVLWKTAMPSVLVELGFISNSSDLNVLRSPGNRDKIAASLYNAFLKYKTQYDSSFHINSEPLAEAEPKPKPEPEPEPEPEPKSVPTPAPAPASTPTLPESKIQMEQKHSEPVSPEITPEVTILYGTQVFAMRTLLNDNDSRFIGYKPFVAPYGELFKYVIGVSDSLDKARSESKKIRLTYKDAFLVRIEKKTSEVSRIF